jgi:hypothetical protein
MSKQHGKSTVFKVGANDLSQYTSASELTIGADSHDTTTYGNDAHRYTGGLLDSKFKASGIYDTTAATGPRAVLLALAGTTVSLTRQTEGTGTGKPQDVFAAVLTSYVESSPVADMVTWSTEWDVDGEVTSTTQV